MTQEDLKKKEVKISEKCHDKIEKAFKHEAKERALHEEQSANFAANDVAYGASLEEAEKRMDDYNEVVDAIIEGKCKKKVQKAMDKAERKSGKIEARFGGKPE